jgi:hypothetical protein
MRAYLVAITLGLVMLAAACGGGDSERAGDTGSDTPTAAAGGGAATATAERATAAATATTGATASPQPSATPEPELLTFTVADGGGGSHTPKSAGPLGIVYADADYAFDAKKNRATAWTSIFVGSQERPKATGWLTNTFIVRGEVSSPVTAQISSDVGWKGVLAGNGAAGTRAAVTITLSVMAGERTLASKVVHTLEQREAVLTVGGFDDIGSESVDMQVALTPGQYGLRLSVTCDAGSGLIGVATHCSFGESDTYDDGYITWGERSILFVR